MDFELLSLSHEDEHNFTPYSRNADNALFFVEHFALRPTCASAVPILWANVP